jgi:hypothetical protein
MPSVPFGYYGRYCCDPNGPSTDTYIQIAPDFFLQGCKHAAAGLPSIDAAPTHTHDDGVHIADSDAHSASTFCARRRHRAITFKNTTRNATNVPSSRGAHASLTPQYCAKTYSWTPHWTCSHCPALTVRRHQRRSHKWALLDGGTHRPPGSSLEGSSAV